MRFSPLPRSRFEGIATAVAVAFLLPPFAHAAAPTTVAYGSLSGVPKDQTSIDLYPCSTSSKALVVYVHGGAWTRGDKDNVHSMATYFSDNNVCFASANYPLSASSGKSLMDQQVAALSQLDSWLQSYGRQASERKAYRNISIIGHSAGAHLVALADKREGWNSSVHNLFLMDSGSYDIGQKYRESSQRYRDQIAKVLQLDKYKPSEYNSVFRRYSPALLPPVSRAGAKRLNVFLLTSQRPNSVNSAEALKKSYQSASGYRVTLYKFPWKHKDFPRKIGVDLGFSQRLLKAVLGNSR